jgi:hypothetical protein
MICSSGLRLVHRRLDTKDLLDAKALLAELGGEPSVTG